MNRFRVMAAVTLAAFHAAGSAQTVTVWTGGGANARWTNAANWDNGVPDPVNGIAQFNTNTATSPDVTANTSLGKIAFASGSDAESFAGTRTLTLNGVSGLGLDNQSGTAQTFANKFALGASQTWRAADASHLTFDGTINLAGFALTLDLAATGSSTVTFNGTVSGTGSSLTVGGAGTVAFVGNGTYTGTTTINSGATLQLSGAAQLSNSTDVTINSGGTFDLNGVSDSINGLAGAGSVSLGSATLTVRSASDTTFSGSIGGTGGLTKSTGTGTLTLSGASTYSGSTNINAGVLRIEHGSALGSSAGGTTVTSGEALELNGGITVNGEALTLTGSGVASGGALRNIGGANTWTGSLTQTGASRINSDAGILTISGDIGGSSNLTLGGSGATVISGAIAIGSRSITKDGSGSSTLSGASTFTGNVTVSAGTLVVASEGALGIGSGHTTVASGAALQVATGGLAITENVTLSGSGSGSGALHNIASSGTNTLSGTVTLGAATTIGAAAGGTLALTGGISGAGRDLTIDAAGTVSISGVIGTGSGALTKEGAGTLTLASPTGNTFSGATTVNAGTLNLAVSNQLSSSAALTIASGASVELNNLFQTVGSLSGAGTLQFGTGGTGQLTLNSGTNTFSGAFGGSGTLIIGSGASLILGANFNAPNLNITLAGGTLWLNGTTSTFGHLQITANSTLDFGSSVASSLTVNNLTFQTTLLTLTINNWVDLSDQFYATNFTGAVPDTRGATPQNQVSFAGFPSANTTWQSFDRQITPTPEPAATGAVLAVAALGVVARRRWRRSGHR